MKLITLLIVLVLVSLPATASANDVTGTWEYRGPSTSGLWLKTLQSGATVHFQLEISSKNSGWIEGEFILSGSSGTFQSSKYATCTISFEFNESSVLIHETQEEHQDCGFGHAVHANGTLTKKNSDKPKFSNGDPRFNE